MDLARRLRTHTHRHTHNNDDLCRITSGGGHHWSPGVSPELRLLVSSDVGASKLLHQDSNDADEQDEIDLVEGQSTTSVTGKSLPPVLAKGNDEPIRRFRRS